MSPGSSAVYSHNSQVLPTCANLHSTHDVWHFCSEGAIGIQVAPDCCRSARVVQEAFALLLLGDIPGRTQKLDQSGWFIMENRIKWMTSDTVFNSKLIDVWLFIHNLLKIITIHKLLLLFVLLLILSIPNVSDILCWCSSQVRFRLRCVDGWPGKVAIAELLRSASGTLEPWNR